MIQAAETGHFSDQSLAGSFFSSIRSSLTLPLLENAT